MDDKCATLILRAPGAAPERPPEESRFGHNAPRPLYLIVVKGGIPGTMVRLKREGTAVGRSVTNDFQIHDGSVSRHHAAIGADNGGDVWISDQGSTNGTFLNGRRLDPHLPARLRDGDRIQFGSSVVVKFVCLDPTDEKFQREMFERTVRDALTGLFHRAYFLDQIGTLADRAASRGLGLAVLLLDLDHFKKVNDTHGHDAGDAVLRELAAVLRESTRTEDLVARYGGEEFVAALPAGAPEQAIERAERIRINLAARRIKVPGTALRVTASLGLAFAPPSQWRNPTSLITTADMGLYQAKHAGRNRVVYRPHPGLDDPHDHDPVTPLSAEIQA